VGVRQILATFSSVVCVTNITTDVFISLVTEGSLGRQVWWSESSSWFLQTQCDE
jgi:phage gp46-like protein